MTNIILQLFFFLLSLLSLNDISCVYIIKPVGGYFFIPIYMKLAHNQLAQWWNVSNVSSALGPPIDAQNTLPLRCPEGREVRCPNRIN